MFGGEGGIGSLRSPLLRAAALRGRTSWFETSGSNPPLQKHKKGGPAGPFFMFGGEGGMGSLRSPLLRAGALRGRTGRFEISGSNPPLRNIKKGALRTPVFIFGGEGGIRTLDTGLPYTHFPGVLLQPLGHLSSLLLRFCLYRKQRPCGAPSSASCLA